MIDLATCKLGETSQQFDIVSREEFYQTMLTMLGQSRRNLVIFSHALEHAIFDTPDVHEAVKQLALSSPRSSVQILVQDITPMTKRGHRLLELSRRLSSSIEIRLASEEHRKILENFILIDDQGIIVREHPERYEAVANFHAPLQCRGYHENFTEMWEHGVVDVSLRKLEL